MRKLSSDAVRVILAGAAVGALSVLLTAKGNPRNMGFCIACFIRDIAGAMRFHGAEAVQYMRPEIPGIALGAFASSLAFGEFAPRSGSSPLLRFSISFAVMIGALCFLGCPLRMIVRISGGDAWALFGLLGFVLGIAVGCWFLNRGFSLGRSSGANLAEGAVYPVANASLLLVLFAVPSLLAFSSKGPGSMRAPALLSLAAGLAVGFASQRARLCLAGGVRDVILMRDFTLLAGFASVLAAGLALNLVFGKFDFGLEGQFVVNRSVLWNIAGMFAVGLGSVMVGGCPLRQLVLAAEGSADSAISVLGMFAGAAFAHNFSLVGNAVGGTYPSVAGKLSVVLACVFLVAVACSCTWGRKDSREVKNG